MSVMYYFCSCLGCKVVWSYILSILWGNSIFFHVASIYLLLTKFEVRAVRVSYRRSFSPRFMAQVRSARAINHRGKNEDP